MLQTGCELLLVFFALKTRPFIVCWQADKGGGGLGGVHSFLRAETNPNCLIFTQIRLHELSDFISGSFSRILYSKSLVCLAASPRP